MSELTSTSSSESIRLDDVPRFKVPLDFFPEICRWEEEVLAEPKRTEAGSEIKLALSCLDPIEVIAFSATIFTVC